MLRGLILGVGGAFALAVGAAPARAEPFGYLPTPTDQIGVPGSASGTEISPTGSLYTGAAELAFRLGPKLVPWNVPTRSRREGWLPVIVSEARSGGVRYTLTVWASPVDGRAVDFASVRMTNPSRRSVVARWRASASWSGGARLKSGARAFRFPRPSADVGPGGYVQPGEPFDAAARWGFSGRAATRSGEVIYLFPAGARTKARMTPGKLTPGSAAGASSYTVRLAPHASRRLVFRLPVDPLPAGSTAVARIAAADPDRALALTIHSWRAKLAPSMSVSIPEAKVDDTYRTSLVTMLESRTPRRGGVMQGVNLLNYHAFWLRDAAMINEAYLLSGLLAPVRENLAYFAQFQQPDGLFISRPDQYDGFGEALWAYAEYARRSGGAAFARSVLPAVGRAMDWLRTERKTDALGLMPFSRTEDNEQISGHLAGDDFWAYAGAAGAVSLATLAGRPELARTWAQEAGGFRSVVRAAVRKSAARHGGAIPPSLDTAGGHDWGNLWGAWPTATLAPMDSAVARTIMAVRGRFREGIATYGRLLHGYIGYRVFETELLRGAQASVVRGLYSELVHTTATNGGFEFASRYKAVGARDNLTPHGWWAAEYVLLLRNMLVREQGSTIRLASAVSPAWLQPGRTVAVNGAPTLDGRVSFTLRSTRTGAVLAWQAWLKKGASVVLTVPSFVTHVHAIGLNRTHTAIRLHGSSGRILIRWARHGAVPTFSGTVTGLTGR